MNINIRVSRAMEGPEAPLGRLERYVIRLPEVKRESLNLAIGEPLHIQDNQGGQLVLTVQPALLRDLFFDESCGYVVKHVFDRINKNTEKRKHEGVLTPINGITYGCDPEFFIKDKKKNEIVTAHGLFYRTGRVGSDCGLVEVRPDPAEHESAVAANMFLLVKIAQQQLLEAMKSKRYYVGKDLEFVARSSIGWKAAGFHLHFGLHPRLKARAHPIRNFLAQIIKILDYYVAIPSIISEGTGDNVRRHKHASYGNPGDFRHTNGITLEYRVPGGHNMRSPMLAEGLIGLGATVVEDAMSRTYELTSGFTRLGVFSNYNHIRELYPRIPDRKVILETVKSATTIGARRLLDPIARDLTEMISFKEHAKSVTRYIEYMASEAHGISESMSENW